MARKSLLSDYFVAKKLKLMQKCIIFSIFVTIFKKSCDNTGFMGNNSLFNRNS